MQLLLILIPLPLFWQAASSTPTVSEIGTAQNMRFVCLIHGMFADNSVFDRMTVIFRERHNLEVFSSKVNAKDNMKRGLKVLATDFATEVMAELETRITAANTASTSVKPTISVSIFGHSMGGIIGRYFVGWFFGSAPLNSEGLEERKAKLKSQANIVPVGFYTAGSPHLGIDTLPTLLPRAMRKIGSSALLLVKYGKGWKTIQEALQLDHDKIWQTMAGEPFIAGIRQFRFNALFANQQDTRVKLASAIIAPNHGFSTGEYDGGDAGTPELLYAGFEETDIFRLLKDGPQLFTLGQIGNKLSSSTKSVDSDKIRVSGSGLQYDPLQASQLAPLFSRRIIFNYKVRKDLMKFVHSGMIGKRNNAESLLAAGKDQVPATQLIVNLIAADLQASK